MTNFCIAGENLHYHGRDPTGSELSQPDVAEEYENAQCEANSNERREPS